MSMDRVQYWEASEGLLTRCRQPNQILQQKKRKLLKQQLADQQQASDYKKETCNHHAFACYPKMAGKLVD